MTLSLVLQALFAGVTNGIVYALVGMGLSAIFKGSRVINAMQGEFAVIGAMTTVLLLTKAGWPYAAAIAGGAIAGALVGAFIEVAFVRYMAKKNASEDSFLLLTIGLALTLSASILYLRRPRRPPAAAARRRGRADRHGRRHPVPCAVADRHRHRRHPGAARLLSPHHDRPVDDGGLDRRGRRGHHRHQRRPHAHLHLRAGRPAGRAWAASW